MLTGNILAGLLKGTEGGDLDDFPAEAYMDDTKSAANNTGVAEQCVYRLRCGVRGNIEVLGVAAQQQVAHCAADQIGLVAIAT